MPAAYGQDGCTSQYIQQIHLHAMIHILTDFINILLNIYPITMSEQRGIRTSLITSRLQN